MLLATDVISKEKIQASAHDRRIGVGGSAVTLGFLHRASVNIGDGQFQQLLPLLAGSEGDNIHKAEKIVPRIRLQLR